MNESPTHVHVKHNALARTAEVTIVDNGVALAWGDLERVPLPADPSLVAVDAVPPLRIPEHVARALYDALGDYFGHSTHDARALRRDYDHERRRVDRLVDALIGS